MSMSSPDTFDPTSHIGRLCKLHAGAHIDRLARIETYEPDRLSHGIPHHFYGVRLTDTSVHAGRLFYRLTDLELLS